MLLPRAIRQHCHRYFVGMTRKPPNVGTPPSSTANPSALHTVLTSVRGLLLSAHPNKIEININANYQSRNTIKLMPQNRISTLGPRVTREQPCAQIRTGTLYHCRLSVLIRMIPRVISGRLTAEYHFPETCPARSV